MMRDLIRLRSSFNVSNRSQINLEEITSDEFMCKLVLSWIIEEVKEEERWDLLEDDIENLKRSERFRSEDVIDIEEEWERMDGSKENMVKVAEKEETGIFRGSLMAVS
ncbi:hypothetical protein Tco_0911398 [Tanacetum coccineum]|uniref:Uncharacterized protein n=1 Tax=Tanacetum coccineum TaxID=301880 RepID=A0ABQ5CYU2_9ASTR